MLPEAFAGGLAIVAGHGLFSACVEREKPYNEIGSRVRLTPRSGLAPTSIGVEAGALTQLFNWWRRHRHLRFATAQRLDHVGPFVFGSDPYPEYY